MQVITGKYRARKLIAVDSDETRPTLARVKESIFNLIASYIENSVVLDLFAGSGSFGVECISRGAKSVVFVDQEEKAIKTIKVQQALKNALTKRSRKILVVYQQTKENLRCYMIFLKQTKAKFHPYQKLLKAH